MCSLFRHAKQKTFISGLCSFIQHGYSHAIALLVGYGYEQSVVLVFDVGLAPVVVDDVELVKCRDLISAQTLDDRLLAGKPSGDEFDLPVL